MTNSFTNDDIGTGRALQALVRHYADDCEIVDAIDNDGEWRVTLGYGGQQITVNVTRREMPTAVHVISALWAHTDAAESRWQSLYRYVRESHPEWLDQAAECKRVFGNDFGTSPKLLPNTVFTGSDGTPFKVVAIQVETDYGMEWTTAVTTV